jgi:hypothetical protein
LTLTHQSLLILSRFELKDPYIGFNHLFGTCSNHPVGLSLKKDVHEFMLEKVDSIEVHSKEMDLYGQVLWGTLYLPHGNQQLIKIFNI